MNRKKYDEMSKKMDDFEITDNDFSWFDSCEGVSPESLSKDYDKIFEEYKPLILKDMIDSDVLTNIPDDELDEFSSVEFHKNRPPTIEKNGIMVFDIEGEDLVIIKKGDRIIGLFYVYELQDIRFRKGEIIMKGWDYDIYYDIKENTFEEIDNR